MTDFEKRMVGLRQVLGYLEARASDDPGMAVEADRARQIIAALDARRGIEALRLLELPLTSQYGGSGWQYVVSISRDLAQRLVDGVDGEKDDSR